MTIYTPEREHLARLLNQILHRLQHLEGKTGDSKPDESEQMVEQFRTNHLPAQSRTNQEPR